MTITWVLESASLSGGVRVIYEMANHLAKKHPVAFLSLDAEPDWFRLDKRISWRRCGNYDALVAALQEDPNRPVIATWWKTVFALERAEVTNGYYLVQDIESAYYSSRAMTELVESTYQKPYRQFTTSRWVHSKLPQATYVGIGLRANRFSSTGKKQRAVLAVARRQALKGYSYLVELATRLMLEMGMPLATFGALDFTLGQGHQHFVSPSDRDVKLLYEDCRYFACTSRHEGFGLPLLEAMAAGCVVVTTDADGVRDFALDGENCLIVSKDDPREMIAALQRLEMDPVLRARLADNGARTAKTWNWEEPFKRLDALFA